MNVQASAVAESMAQPELRTLLLRYRRENWKRIQTPEWQERVVESMLSNESASILKRIGEFVDLPRGSSILDVGSGIGSFVLGCRELGYAAFGVEPDRIGSGASITSIQIARARSRQHVFAAATGENLPFADGTFELVTLNQVIEHVKEQAAVIREALRVTKDGGAIYVACPNYLRFYEPHYKVFWFPLLPKCIARLYLRCRKRDPVLLEQITYTTNRRLRRLLADLCSEIQVVDLHRESFLKKCADGSFASRRARIIARLQSMPLIGRVVRECALFFLRCTEGGCEMLVIRTNQTVVGNV